jgi:hypothetical protein
LLSPCSCCHLALAVALLLLSPCSCCRPTLAVRLICMFLDLLDLDPLVPGTDPDPNPSMIKQKY